MWGEKALNQHLFRVTSSRFEKWFYLHWTKHQLDDFCLVAAGKATTMGHIQRSHLSAAKLFVADSRVLKASTGLLTPIVDRFIANAIQTRTLASLRDELLPRLVSGQLRVGVDDAGRDVG